MGSGGTAGEGREGGREGGRDKEQPQNTKNTCVSHVFCVFSCSGAVLTSGYVRRSQ